MRMIATVVIVVVASLLILWMREGADFHIARVFPLLNREYTALYTVAGIIMLLITLRGIARLFADPTDERDTDDDVDEAWDEGPVEEDRRSDREPDDEDDDE